MPFKTDKNFKVGQVIEKKVNLSKSQVITSCNSNHIQRQNAFQQNVIDFFTKEITKFILEKE